MGIYIDLDECKSLKPYLIENLDIVNLGGTLINQGNKEAVIKIIADMNKYIKKCMNIYSNADSEYKKAQKSLLKSLEIMSNIVCKSGNLSLTVSELLDFISHTQYLEVNFDSIRSENDEEVIKSNELTDLKNISELSDYKMFLYGDKLYSYIAHLNCVLLQIIGYESVNEG